MKKRIVCLALVILLLSTFAGCCLSHEWAEATCTAPKTCTKCGKTEGDVIPHDWEDATCTAPETCSECGETKGDMIPHDWEDATCAAPKTCKECGETEGSPLDHVQGEWTIDTEATYSTSGVRKAHCTLCGEVLAEESYTKECIQNGLFVFTKRELMDMLDNALKEYSSDFLVLDDATYIAVASGQKVDYLLYFFNDDKTASCKMDDPLKVESLLVVFARENYREVHLSTIIECCYPGISAEDLEYGVKLLQNNNKFICGNLIFNPGDFDGYEAVMITIDETANQ